MDPAISPNGGSVRERRALEERFRDRISANPEFTRKTVSYQGNRSAPGFRWMKYKEGFSQTLVERILDEFRPENVLDPFAGIGTAPLIAAGRDMEATGIEIMPVGVSVGDGIATAANGLSKDEFQLIEGYCLEMAIIVSELGRVVRPGGTVIMVNDNVQYHGEEVPIDLILSDCAEQSGFRCENIWTLPRGKGNSSQQMKRFGRREIRKCVYKWRKSLKSPAMHHTFLDLSRIRRRSDPGCHTYHTTHSGERRNPEPCATANPIPRTSPTKLGQYLPLAPLISS